MSTTRCCTALAFWTRSVRLRKIMRIISKSTSDFFAQTLTLRILQHVFGKPDPPSVWLNVGDTHKLRMLAMSWKRHQHRLNLLSQHRHHLYNTAQHRPPLPSWFHEPFHKDFRACSLRTFVVMTILVVSGVSAAH